MPRKIGLAAAGRYILDNPTLPGIGRGSVDERAATILNLGIALTLEYLLEGGDPGYRTPTVNGAVLISSGTAAAIGGPPFSFASVDSIDYGVIVDQGDRHNSNYNSNGYVWEMWYMHPSGTGHDRSIQASPIQLVCSSNNDNAMVGGRRESGAVDADNFPSCVNVFNNDKEWKSMFDLYGDDKVHQLVEAHDIGNRNNYIAVIDGIPVAVGTNGGQLLIWDAAGISFNGQNQTPDSERAGGSFGSHQVWDNGSTLDLQAVRELFETSALNGHDMLTLPHWIPLDAENVPFVQDFQWTIANMGDVSGATGIRSGAIPREGKVYFEMEVLNQGDNPNGANLGIRRMISAADVGAQTEVADSGEKHHFFSSSSDIYYDNFQDSGINVDAGAQWNTGATMMIAIDWQTGLFWMGRNGVWGNNGGDPANSLNPIDTIDRQTNWAASANILATFGNQIIRLKTRFYEMKYTLPIGYDTWVPKSFELDSGPNRRAGILEFMGVEKGREYLMDVGSVAGMEEDTGIQWKIGNDMILTTEPRQYQEPPLTYAAEYSVNWGTTRAIRGTIEDADVHAFELTFKQPDTGQTLAGLLNSTANRWEVLGRNVGFNFPSARNNFNGDLHWESEVDLWADDQIHTLIEYHESPGSANFVIAVDGMPVTFGTDFGWMKFVGGWEVNADCNTADNRRSQGNFGALIHYRGGQPFNLQDVRKLYEASAIDEGADGRQANIALNTGGSDIDVGVADDFEVLDYQMTAKSILSASFDSHDARLNGPIAWSQIDPQDQEDWLQIDLVYERKITGISTQGWSGGRWTTSYKLQYSDDGIMFTNYNAGEILTGNVDASSVVTNALMTITARYIRVIPWTWNISAMLRVELHEDKGVSDDQMTASSEFGVATYKARFGRLNNPDVSFWRPLANSTAEWLQIDFLKTVDVSAITTQGGGGSSGRVETYQLEYSNDETTWLSYNGSENLAGNTDASTKVQHDLIPFRCRYVRIRPQTWNNYIALRCEFVLDRLTGPRFSGISYNPRNVPNLGDIDYIPDASISSSGDFGGNYLTVNGRMNYPIGTGWGVANPPDVNQWWKVDFGSVQRVMESHIQPSRLNNEYITGYELEYSDDDIIYVSYNSNEVLVGNVSGQSEDIVTNVLSPFYARYVRVHPKTWVSWIVGRFEFTVDNLRRKDMLTNARWCAGDVENTTVGGVDNKDATLGDVNNNTGVRSYAIPRHGKVYFEFFVIAQGDNVNATLVGLMKAVTPIEVGTYYTTPSHEFDDDQFKVIQGQVFKANVTTTLAGITGNAGAQATGHTIKCAIDWDTGGWWLGDADLATWMGQGGAGDPATGAFPFQALELEYNWCAWTAANGISGSGATRLVTAALDMVGTIPSGFLAWEDAR